MCLAIPMKVVSIQGNQAQVEQAGSRRSIRIDLLEEVEVGDYVLVHAGFAIARVDQEEAALSLSLLGLEP